MSPIKWIFHKLLLENDCKVVILQSEIAAFSFLKGNYIVHVYGVIEDSKSI